MAVLDYAGLRRYDGKIKQYTGDLVDTVVEVTDTQPVDLYNKVWISPSEEEFELAEMSDIGDLKKLMLSRMAYESNWVVGTLNSTSGTAGISTASIRSDYSFISDDWLAVSCKTGYKLLVFGFVLDDGIYTYLGWWKNGTFVKTSGALNYYVPYQDLTEIKTAGANAIRVVVRREDSADMSIEEFENVEKEVLLPSYNKQSIDTLKTEIDPVFSSVKYDDEITNFINGSYIKTNGAVGTTVDINNPIPTSTLSYKIVPCVKGDTFHLYGYGYNAPRLWAFTNDTYTLVSKAASDAYSTTPIELVAETDGYLIMNTVNTHEYYLAQVKTNINLANDVETIKKNSNDKNNGELTDLVQAQKDIADDWHFSFINVYGNMGLGNNHIIPGTATTWNPSGTSDLTQKNVWMSDGVHPFKGDGTTDMYARTIANQLLLVTPSYKDGVGETTPTYWVGRKIMWMGTSIPAGSDPDAGSGTGSTYPALVAQQLSASSINVARGSSCVRINASTGTYNGMIFNHFKRALTRTISECDAIANDWANIYSLIGSAPSELSAEDVTVMKNHSYETLLLPRLNGTLDMPDLFVIDHGHNDVRPKGIDGKRDLWVTPTVENIENGLLAEDVYMTANNYANLKLALNNDLSGISDLEAFSASINRNCFKGAMNFLITVILRYNPYARIAIISDYN